MGSLRSTGGLGVALLLLSLGGSAPPVWAQAAAGRPQKSVYGTLVNVDTQLNGAVMKTNSGERMAWRFDAAVIAELARFKPGDPMIVIYRQVSPTEKRVTAIAFPGAATTALYVNMTGSRVTLRSAPDVGGVCGTPDAGPVTDLAIPREGMSEATDACWCCAVAGESCIPGNKTGKGKALLVGCFNSFRRRPQRAA